MKIVFDNEKERNEFTKNVSEWNCPSNLNLKNRDCYTYDLSDPKVKREFCCDCWNDALKEISVIKE